MKKRKRGYKVYVRFSQVMPIIVEAYSARGAMQKALEKASAMSVDGEEVETVSWLYLEKEKNE